MRRWLYKKFIILESNISSDSTEYFENKLQQYHVRYFRYKLNKSEYRYIICSKDLERVKKENCNEKY